MKIFLLCLLVVLLFSCGTAEKFSTSAGNSTDTNSDDTNIEEDTSTSAPLSTSTNGEVLAPSYK